MAEETIELPLNIIKASVGFALDIGGSVAKIVYRSKKDFSGGEPRDKGQVKSGLGRLHLKLIAREKLDEVIDFVKENCDITYDDNEQRVAYTTGVGGNKFHARLEQELNLKLVNMNEMECFVTATCSMLKDMPREEVFRPVDQTGIEVGNRMAKMFESFKTAAAASGKGRFIDERDFQDVKWLGAEEGDKFPFLMVMCGSNFGWLKVEEDGTYAIAGTIQAGGRFFLGTTSFLTGITDFDEISRMIEESDGRTADTFMEDMLDPNAEEDFYTSLKCSEFRIFPLGKALSKSRDKATKGDIVHSILETVCETVAQHASTVALSLRVPRVYFVGNFVNTPKAQQFITKMAAMMETLNISKKVEIQFINHGGHLGAIGAFLESSKSC